MIQDRRVSLTGLVHVRQDTSSLGVLGGSGVGCHRHKNVRGVESEILLRTEVAEGIPRHYKVTRGLPELLTMTANGRVQRGRSLSFDASPPDVPLSSIWTDRDLESLEGSDETEGSSGGTIYVNFRLRKHT